MTQRVLSAVMEVVKLSLKVKKLKLLQKEKVTTKTVLPDVFVILSMTMAI